MSMTFDLRVWQVDYDDISITENGQLPDFSAIPSEVGKLVAGAAPSLHCSVHVPCM